VIFNIISIFFGKEEGICERKFGKCSPKQIIVHTSIAKVGLPIVIMEGGGRNWLIAIKGFNHQCHT